MTEGHNGRNWVTIGNDDWTEALEITGVGALVRTNHVSHGFSCCFVPGVRILDGQLVKETRAQPQLGGTLSHQVLDIEPDY